jgi:hypothetical protein
MDAKLDRLNMVVLGVGKPGTRMAHAGEVRCGPDFEVTLEWYVRGV